jgi:hypothetical protein
MTMFMGNLASKKVSIILPMVVLTVFVFTSFPAFSQATPDSKTPTFKVFSRLVLVDVIPEYIKNEHGQSVTLATQLQQESFRVFDNGKEMPISSFDSGREHTTRPIALWLIVQCPEELEKGWASDFLRGKTELLKPALKYLEPQDVVGVAHWCDNGEASIDLAPQHGLDAPVTRLEQMLSQPVVRGGDRRGELAMQNLIRLLVDDAQHFKPDRLPVLLFLYGDHSATYPDEAEKIIESMLEGSGIVFGMSDGSWKVDSDAGYNGYGQIKYLVHHYSNETGGQYYTTADPQLFSAAVGYIIAQLHLRYTLGFKPLAVDGKRHKIKVELTKEGQKKLPGVDLRFRREYIPVAGDPSH